MKRLFLFLLKRYTRTEKERMEVYEQLWDSVTSEYNEQSGFGNIYNMQVEFLMANPFISKLVLEKDRKSLSMIKRGIQNSFGTSIEYIEKERFDRIPKIIKRSQEKIQTITSRLGRVGI